MWSIITGFFSNTKNILMAIGTAIIGGYVLTQKYKAYKAEDKLKDIETKIAKTNVEIAKKTAKAKATAKDIEHTTEVEVLRELNQEKEKVVEEMAQIEETLEKTKKETPVTKVVDRAVRKKVTIEV